MPDQIQQPPQNPQQGQQAATLVIGDNISQPIHTDGFYSIRMLGDTVRIPIFSYVAAADETPHPVITGIIAMSLPAFLKSAEIIEGYIKNLEAAGVIKKQDGNTQS